MRLLRLIAVTSLVFYLKFSSEVVIALVSLYLEGGGLKLSFYFCLLLFVSTLVLATILLDLLVNKKGKEV